MRLDEDDEPLVHRVVSDAEYKREAQMGLDQLLAKARVILSREARQKAAKATEEELEIVRQRRMRLAQAAADRFEWKPVASVVMFDSQTCLNCGSVHHQFRGWGTLYQRKADFTERVGAAPCLDRGLPFQKRSFVSQSPACVDCLEEFTREEPFHPPSFTPSRKETPDATPSQHQPDSRREGLPHPGERCEAVPGDVLPRGEEERPRGSLPDSE